MRTLVGYVWESICFYFRIALSVVKIFLAIGIFCAGCYLFVFIGRHQGREEIIKQAIKAGVGEYQADQDGEVKFHWRSNVGQAK